PLAAPAPDQGPTLPTPDLAAAPTDETAARIEAAHEALAQAEADRVVGRSAVEVIEAATEMMRVAQATRPGPPDPEAEARKAALHVRAIRAAGGLLQALAAAAGLHAWATSPAGSLLLTRTQPLLEWFASLFP
ncbi:MAG TPA: hypothetical protein VJ994_01275, partial [Paracoccaceae bacterium]|nr:hypothetical protein [Paracoccaceae bacterium]